MSQSAIAAGVDEKIQLTMLESNATNSAASGVAQVKRYAPPNQRNNWSHGRRKSSGDGLDRANRGNDGGRNLIGVIKSGPMQDSGDTTGNYGSVESIPVKLIPLHGCCNSGATELLSNRWTAAMNAYNSLQEDSAERPIIYRRSTPLSWSHAILPHMMIQHAGRASSGLQLQQDFLTELRQAMASANPYSNP